MDKKNEKYLTCENAGTSDRAVSVCWGPGIRNVFIIHYVIKGKGYYEVSGKTHEIKAGQCFLIFPYTYIHYYPDERDPWEYTWIDFFGSEAEDILANCALSLDSPVSEKLDGKILDSFMSIASDFISVTYTDKLLNNAGLLTILAELCRLHPIENQTVEHKKITTRAAKYIEANFHDTSLSVESISHQLNVSRTSLYRHFLRNFKTSPVNYIASVRVQRACELLRDSDISVKNVAHSVGFSDCLYFSKVFKKITGVPPTEYRNVKTK